MKWKNLTPGLRASLVYAFFGMAWILFSDWVLETLVKDIHQLNQIQTYKGWFFVLASALVVLLLLNRELTLREAAEAQSRESEQRYRLIFENSMDAILLTQPDGTILEANPAACRLLGRSAEEITQLRREDLVDPNSPNMKTAIEERALTRRFSGELIFIGKDGRQILVEASSSIFYTHNGQARSSLIMRDITERKKAEQRLRHDEQILRMFVEYSPASIAMFDRNMRYIVASRRYMLDYELGEQDLIGRSHYEVFPEITDQWKEMHRRCLAGSVERVEEDVFARSSGKIDWVRWEIRPWYEMNNEIGGIILFSEVITEQKQAEHELQHSRDRLAELSRRLTEVHEMERRSVGRELHDQFGQILTAIKITLDIARQMNPDAAARKIQQAQDLTLDLINRVSQISLELRPPMLDDLGLVPALLWHTNRYQEQTGITLTFKHSGVEGVRFPSQVETTAYRIVQESLTNIARHAHAANVWLEVELRNNQIEIRIIDDGQGFQPETAFAQNRGLSGMRERARLMGGSFEVESVPGQGAQLLVQLPL